MSGEDRGASSRAQQRDLRATELVLSDSFAGTEGHVALLSRGLAALGVKVRLVCGDRNTRLIDEMRDSGVDVRPLRLGKGNLPVDWRAAYRAIVGWNPHIVHAQLGSSLLCGAVLTWRGERLIFTQQFVRPAYLNATGPGAVVRALGHRLAHGRVAYGIATTQLVRSEMIKREGFAKDQTTVIPLAIDAEHILTQARTDSSDVRTELVLPHDASLLIAPARLEREKDHHTLLACLPRVLARHPNTYLLLAGSGALESALREQAHHLDIMSHVRFLGQRADVPRLLLQGTLCVLPSYEEPFGLVLLEAMAVATPVVACNAGGPRDIVIDGETGLLVSPRDAGAMAQAVIAILTDRDRARAMGVAGRERVQRHFSARQMATRTLQEYRRVIAG